jgi:nucleotide-binding universal stress UspA family protein
MFKKILSPVDLTDRHGAALKIAGELGEQSGGEIVLLHVIEVIRGLSLEEEREFYSRLERVARRHLAQLAEQLQARAGRVHAEVIYGERGPEIVRFAAASGVDLIVLTSPRLDPNQPSSGWGSLSYKIGMLCPCPVLLVK